MPGIYKRGAQWRRWDLHIHSPESIEQGYGGEKAWPKFIEALENLPSDVKAIGITDYYFIDGYERLSNEKSKNNRLKNIDQIFPILEFRVDTFGSASHSKLSKINVHVLFDVDEENIKAEIKLIRERFIEQIHLSSADEHKTIPLSKDNMIKESSDGKLSTGFRDFIPSTNELFDLLNKKPWKDKTLVFLGYEEWHSLDKGQQAKVHKEELYKSADAFLSASAADAITKKQDVLKQFGQKVFFHSLDIHCFKEFEEYKCLTWIKADPTFKGLKHALLNANERVFIGHSPPRLLYEQDNSEYFINTLTIESTSTGTGWFDDLEPIALNKGLVAIIGDKGSGKSALADIIALGGNSSRQNYSFLRKRQFLAAPTHKNYSAVLSFCDGTSNKCKFGEPKHKNSKRERVTYLSQSFVNQLCDEVAGAKHLGAEIDRVIFSHLPKEKKLKQESLRKLIQHRAGAFDTTLEELREELREVNETIVELEDWTGGDYQEQIESLAEKQAEALKRHEASQPVKPPQSGSVVMSVKLVEKYVNRKAEFEEIVDTRRASVVAQEFERDHLAKAKVKILALQKKVVELVEELSTDKVFADNSIDVKSLVTMDVSTDSIDTICEQKATLIEQDNHYIDRVETVIGRIDEFIDRQRTGQTEAQRLQHNFVVESRNWEKKKKRLLGSEDKKNTMAWYEKELEKIAKVYPAQLKAKYDERNDLAKSIVVTLIDKEEAFEDIYSHVQDKAVRYAKELEIPISEFIEFTARIAIADDFGPDFFSFIDQNRTGTFYRRDRGEVQLSLLLPSQSEINKDVLRALPARVIHALNHNLQNDPAEDTKMKDQLVGDQKVTKLEIYNFLYSFEYVNARFSITYTGKSITKLSPGEKGILLLAFYLLIDDNPNPIIIDQPEENVGNLTISKRLVDFIRLARKRRQILMVTHNANLAIVCDADQIILCEMDKVKDNAITYSLGSIEYDKMKGRSIDILEGTKTSFDSRKDVWELLPDI